MNKCDRDSVSLVQRQKYSLEMKIRISEQRIKEWYERYQGKVYVSFSGGKDSTVLLHLVRKLYPDVVAVYVDTGLEFPENKEFVKTVNNVIQLKPKIPFTQVIERYGYPIVSKEQSQYIYQYRTAKSEKTKDTRWNGNKYGRGKISEKWKYLVDAPFRISDRCCDVMKKQPFKQFEKQTGLKPYIGVMAIESSNRVQDYVRNGCNAFKAKRPTSKPLAFWLEKDIWDYIKINKLEISKIYSYGYERTGCMFCLYGHHLSDVNRLLKIQQTHPKIYEYMMKRLNLELVLRWYPEKIKE